MPIAQTVYVLVGIVIVLAAGGIGALAHYRPQLVPALTLSVAVAVGLASILLPGQ